MKRSIAICGVIILLVSYTGSSAILKNSRKIVIGSCFHQNSRNESWLRNLQHEEYSGKISTSNFTPGSYAKVKLNKPVPSAILENDAIVGVLISASWKTLEPQEGVYDWNKLDKRIEEAIAHGKKISLNIMAGGINTPQWLFEKYDIQTFTFVDLNKYHKSYLQNITIPVFWDPIFLEKKMYFIKALGKRYSNNPNVVAVMVSFANAITNDWNVPHYVGRVSGKEINQVRDWLNVGYTHEKMLYAGMLTINTWAEAFPIQCLKLPIGKTHEKLDGSKTKLAEDIVEYAYSSYPDRFFIQINALSSMFLTADSVTNAQPGEPFYLLKLLVERSPQVGLQMLAAASNGYRDGFRLNGGKFGFPKNILLNTINIGLSYNPYYVEYWEADATDKRLMPVIKYATDAMKNGLSIYINKPRGLCIFDRQFFPANVAIVIGKTTIETIVYSKNTIWKVEFYIDGNLKFVDNTPPYQWRWNEFVMGKHEIKVVAYDGMRNKAEDRTNIIILSL